MNCSLNKVYSPATQVSRVYSILKTNGPDIPTFTHVSMGKTRGQYYLSATDEKSFFKNYADCVASDARICLAEKPDEYAPLIGDIDIKIESEDQESRPAGTRVLYSTEELLGVVECFQNAIKATVVGYTSESLTCVVLEKKPYVSDPNSSGTRFLKNGFHVHFPHLFAEAEKIKSVIVPKAREEVSKYALPSSGKGLFHRHTDTPQTFVDDVATKCWLMYGSSKNETSKPYKLSAVYDGSRRSIELHTAFNACYARDETRINVTEENATSLLPRLLSLSSIKKNVFAVKTPQNMKSLSKVHLKTKLKDISNSENIKKNLDQAKYLLKLLASSRSEEYNQWWEIGIIMFNIGRGCNEAFNMWNAWSSSASNYDEDACTSTWDAMVERSGNVKGMGSLKWLAKKDNPVGYTAYVELTHGLSLEQNDETVEIMTTDAPLSHMLLDLFGGEYVFTDAGWYHFNGVIWASLKIDKIFRAKLENISKHYRDFRKKIATKLYREDDSGNDSENETDDDDDQPLSKQSKNILKLKLSEINKAVNKLENFNSQNGILKMCEVLFYDEDFYEKLDQNPQIIGFKNGVFDLELMAFREGSQSDYISKTLDIKYKPDLKSAELADLKDFLIKIFPDEAVRAYFVEQTCEVFRGGNRDKIAMFWTGNGNNGKSVTQKLFETMLGKKMAIKLSTSLLTDRIQPGSPNPQLTRLRKGVRWGVFDEIRKSEQIDCGSLKVLTGGDSLPCRDLFQRGQDTDDFTPMFKFLCICNELPGLKDADEATWDRIRVIPFESKFAAAEKCPSTLSEQHAKKIFVCDTEITLPKRMKQLATALGWYLIDTLKRKETLRQRGTYVCIIPDKVNDAKIKYQTKCDILSYFMEDTFVCSGREQDKIQFDSMYTSFKAWYIESFSNKMPSLNKKDFIEMVKNKYKLLENDKCLKGFAWNRQYEDDDD